MTAEKSYSFSLRASQSSSLKGDDVVDVDVVVVVLVLVVVICGKNVEQSNFYK